jgi:hypothetical protein
VEVRLVAHGPLMENCSYDFFIVQAARVEKTAHEREKKIQYKELPHQVRGACCAPTRVITRLSLSGRVPDQDPCAADGLGGAMAG